jgi:hypothetical protein
MKPRVIGQKQVRSSRGNVSSLHHDEKRAMLTGLSPPRTLLRIVTGPI